MGHQFRVMIKGWIMIKLKKYEIAPYLNYEKLIKAGFINKRDYYVIDHTLYCYDGTNKPYITLKIMIDDYSYYKLEYVLTDSGDVYPPFLNPELRKHNLVYDAIAKEYNSFMDKLVKKEILVRVKEDNKLENCEVIKIKYHTDIEPLEAIESGDLIDLRAAESVDLARGEFKLISLGVSMELPPGYMAKVYPRSSTYKNFGIILANSTGIIDESYCGDNDVWKFPAIALRKTHIEKGDRIAQFEIVKKQPPIRFEVVDHLGNKDRGGIGSTGTK